jgi:murein DD-endopeptidase MepM/ murein hydrolase activator NlpD
MRKILGITICFIFLLLQTTNVAANKIDELRREISQKNEAIKQIESEISKYQQEINRTLEEKESLENEIKKLRVTANKLKAEMNLTSNKIDNTNLAIQKLNIEIVGKKSEIKAKKNSLAEIIRILDEEDSRSLLEILLAHASLSEFFANIERMEYLQKDINLSLKDLKSLKEELESHKLAKTKQKNQLKQLQERLADKKQLIEANKNNRKRLLAKTQNKEENYRKLLREKKEKRKLFLSELADLEAQLQFEVDPSRLPRPGTGILGWPMKDLSFKSCWNGGGEFKNCVTQFFGNTPFATQNPQVYGGKGHNGIDFRASVGTRVMAASDGMVEDVGNTDTIPGCYSYGKWVLIKHNNGLSTLYAHLSLIKVQKGQNVKRGELIGYSGQTGYATGSHLHFTVYASQGVKIMRLGDIKKITNCADAYIPIADKRAYLNPLSYL